VLLSIYAVGYGDLRYYAGSGLLLGLATLTRGTTQYYPLFFLAILAVLAPRTRATLRKSLVFLLCFVSVILPWSVRNYVVLGDVIPVATAGSVFLQGSSETFLTISGKIREYPGYFRLLESRGLAAPPSGSSPAAADRYLFRAGLENYKMRLETDPLSIAPFLAKKLARLWYATESGRNHWKTLSVNLLFYLPAAAGIVLAWRRRLSLALLVFGVLGYFVLIHWVSLPLFRYMVPVMPYVIASAAFAVVVLWDRLWPRTSLLTGSRLGSAPAVTARGACWAPPVAGSREPGSSS
jgi:hypothetical protein